MPEICCASSDDTEGHWYVRMNHDEPGTPLVNSYLTNCGQVYRWLDYISKFPDYLELTYLHDNSVYFQTYEAAKQCLDRYLGTLGSRDGSDSWVTNI